MTSEIHVGGENATAPSHVLRHDRSNEVGARVIRPYETFEKISLTPELSLHCMLHSVMRVRYHFSAKPLDSHKW